MGGEDCGSLEALYCVHRQPMARGSTRVESVGCGLDEVWGGGALENSQITVKYKEISILTNFGKSTEE